MLYRVLGVLSLALGVLFALVTVLVFLPFLSNYNTSLLVLTLIFAIFSWIFASIGWQLLHPPHSRGGRVVEESAVDVGVMGPGPEAAAVRTTPAGLEASAPPEPDTSSIQPVYAKLTPVPDAMVASTPPSDDSQQPVVSPEAGGDPTGAAADETTVLFDDFVGFGGDGSAPRADARADNGASGNGRSTGSARPQFRKPGAPLPPDRALG